MSTWRRKAIALFPDLRHELQRPKSTVYTVFFELLPMVRAAHVNGDTAKLRWIYGFAVWCFRQTSGELSNAAAVGFYEHLFDSHASLWREFVRWLSPRVIEDCWGLWELWRTEEELATIRRLIAECRQPRYAGLGLNSLEP